LARQAAHVAASQDRKENLFVRRQTTRIK
jgi:hypothetical protein